MSKKIIYTIAVFVVIIFISGALIVAYNATAYPLKYKNEINECSNIFDVDKALIAAVINAESKFKVDAISKKGAVGLMQVMPTTAKWVVEKLSGESIEIELLYGGNKNSILLSPYENIKIGTYYLAYLLDKFKDVKVAICAYNAGEGTVKNWLKNQEYSKDGITLTKIPYKETKNYLNKVLTNIKVYKNKF